MIIVDSVLLKPNSHHQKTMVIISPIGTRLTIAWLFLTTMTAVMMTLVRSHSAATFLFTLICGATALPSSRRTTTATNNNNRQQQQKKMKKNILLLVTDDQDIDLGSFDHMPAISQYFQKDGTCFEGGGFVHTPVCCPSRSTILTGRYLHHGKGMAINNSITGNCYGHDWRSYMEPYHTFVVHAQASGYTTAFCGKYLNQYHATVTKKKSGSCCDHNDENDIDETSIPPGWDYWFGLEGNSRYYNTTIVEAEPVRDNTNNNDSETQHNRRRNITIHRHGDQYPLDYLPLIIQNYTLKLLPTLQEPWIMMVAWPTPHAPFTPEPWADGLHPNNRVPIDDPNYNASQSSQQQKHWLLRQLGPLNDETAATIDKYYRMRLDALVTVDRHVRAMMESLVTSQQLDRTVAIYTSDNGFQFGQHRLAIDKRHLYENDIRVPFCVRGPDIPTNTTISNKIVSTIDIAPTILDVILEGQLIDVIDVTTTTTRSVLYENATTPRTGEQVDDDDNDKVRQVQQRLMIRRLQIAIDEMSGYSFWKFLTSIQRRTMKESESVSSSSSSSLVHPPVMDTHHHDDDDDDDTDDDPFTKRTDILISYHGEGFIPCNMAECPPPYNDIWWMPDSFNNTYNCVRTLYDDDTTTTSYYHYNDGNVDVNTTTKTKNTIYCRFVDDEAFVEYYDLITNPYQMNNDYHTLEDWEVQMYEQRLKELLMDHDIVGIEDGGRR